MELNARWVTRNLWRCISRGAKIPGTDKYKSDLMQLPSFESVSKCSLAERRRAPVHCARNEGSRGLFVFRRETPRGDHNFSRGDFIYRNVVDPRDETTWTTNFRRPRFPRCRTTKTMLAKRQRLHGTHDVIRLELSGHTADLVRNVSLI